MRVKSNLLPGRKFQMQEVIASLTISGAQGVRGETVLGTAAGLNAAKQESPFRRA
jgi:hypothetical protein